MFKSEYLNRVYEGVEKRSPGEKEFLQAVREVLGKECKIGRAHV